MNGDMFVDIATCKILGGPKKAPLYAGIGVAVAGEVLFQAVIDDPSHRAQVFWTTLPIILGAGGIAALFAYLTCEGVQEGLRVHK
jgi:hypothetical protein